MKIFKRVLCLGLSAVFILSIVIPVFAETEEKGPVTKTSYGFVRGLYYDGGECYLGIPYAKATTGNLRFTPPVAPDSWDNVLDAVYQPKKSVQTGFNVRKHSEDSLKLNIWVPDT